MKLNRTLTRCLRKFRNENGSFSVEAVLMFPMLVWAFVAMFVFFEGLRESNINLKATYTVSDLLSRETDLIDQDYLEGMQDVYTWLSRTRNDVNLRVTAVRYDAAADRHVRMWSEGVGVVGLSQEEVNSVVTPNVPIMADAAWAIVVETWASYTPVMRLGLGDTDIYNLVVTAPRFSDQLDFAGRGDGGGSVHDDGTGGEDESL
ncbi:MAG: pilus assembly protein [Paracoccaceae bacterium]